VTWVRKKKRTEKRDRDGTDDTIGDWPKGKKGERNRARARARGERTEKGKDRRLEQEDWTGRIAFWGVVGQDWVMEDVRKQPVVREVVCKTVLNRSEIADYSLNCYGGCTHACVYCYARFMERFHPHGERVGRVRDVKANAVEALDKQLHPAREKACRLAMCLSAARATLGSRSRRSGNDAGVLPAIAREWLSRKRA